MRMRTVSRKPPKYPATPPHAVPMITEIVVASTLITSDRRAPLITSWKTFALEAARLAHEEAAGLHCPLTQDGGGPRRRSCRADRSTSSRTG